MVAAPAELSARPTDSGGGDSMAARLARQRQQRSALRMAAPGGAEAAVTSAAVVGELSILRAEVAQSGTTISNLQTQLKQSEEEIEQMGQNTARMAEELRLLKEQQAAAAGAPAASLPTPPPPDGPMSVGISLGEDNEVTVSVSIGCDEGGQPRVALIAS